jgi:hypothetical protein
LSQSADECIVRRQATLDNASVLSGGISRRATQLGPPPLKQSQESLALSGPGKSQERRLDLTQLPQGTADVACGLQNGGLGTRSKTPVLRVRRDSSQPLLREVGTLPPPRLKHRALAHQRFADDGRDMLSIRQARLEPFCGFAIPALMEGRRKGK